MNHCSGSGLAHTGGCLTLLAAIFPRFQSGHFSFPFCRKGLHRWPGGRGELSEEEFEVLVHLKPWFKYQHYGKSLERNTTVLWLTRHWFCLQSESRLKVIIKGKFVWITFSRWSSEKIKGASKVSCGTANIRGWGSESDKLEKSVCLQWSCVPMSESKAKLRIGVLFWNWALATTELSGTLS